MKKFYTAFLFLVATLTFSQSSLRYYNSWRFGMNMGGMWQVSDMKAYAGIAGGLTLEKGFLENKTNFFSLAVKLRWLSGRTYGQNFNRNYDVKNNSAYNGTYDAKVNYFDSVAPSKRYVYDNYRTPISEGALELQLEFNRLRQQTHIIFNLWGGIGFSGFRANSNLLDANGKRYDFSKMDSSGTSSALSSLSANTDGSYESWALGSKQKDIFTFSPSGGIGLGYQVSPGFAIIFEYKVSLPKGINADLLDGSIRGNNDWLGKSNDYYKYAGVNLRLTFGQGSSSTHTSVTNPDVYTSVGTHTTSHTNSLTVNTNTNVTFTDIRPIVNITNPPYSPYNTTTNNFEVRAKVYNVNSRNEIYVTFNGQSISNYNYNFNTKDLSFYTNLNIGYNNLIITASNKAGSDTKSAVINLQGNPPEIIISNPSSNPYTSNTALANVDASIKNVTSSNNLYVKFNGNPISFFNFNPQNLQFFVQLNLHTGSNVLEISATNDFGKDYASQTLIYNPFTVTSTTVVASRPVTVIITDPATSPYTIKQPSYNVKSKVTGVNSANQVSVTVNGIKIPFNYSAGNVTFSADLLVGANYVTVSAANESSADSKSTIIIYEEQRVVTPPSVVITNPPSSPYTSNVAGFTFKAVTKNIQHISQILAKYNGNQISNYSFNASTGEIEFYTALTINANNVFEVAVNNQDGSSYASAIVIYHEIMIDPIITICYPENGVKKTITIKQSEWLTYKMTGATLGECPKEDPLITICHSKEDGAKQTLSIKQSEWPTHQSHGDHLGVCSADELDPSIIICHKNGNGTSSTLKIKQSEWSTHQSHGDNLGICIAGTEDVNITICNKNTDGSYQTLSIKQSEWPKYQSAGAHLGACTAEELDPSILICNKKPDGTYQTATIKKSQWPQYAANGSHLGACTPEELDPIITICHKNTDGSYQNNSIKTSEWASHQAHGDHLGACTADELDQNINICHNNGNGTWQNMVIKQSQWMTHSVHGDHLGSCSADELDGVVTICHKNSDGSVQTMSIKNSEWDTHAAHGDHKGVCTQEELDPTITICHIENGVKQKINIPSSKWPIHQAHGDNMGPCVVDELKVITICHKQQGGSAETMSINESEWPAHQAHGDHLGACTADELDPIITICHEIPGNLPQNLNIKTSEWPLHQAHGDHMGACTSEELDPTILICHKNSNGTSQNMNVKQSQWPSHQAHGDHMGACTPDELDPVIGICHKNGDGSSQNMSIKMSEWSSHASHGDHQGACTPDELDPIIEICHVVTPDQKQNMNIKLSEWPAHQSHGDVRGRCPKIIGTEGQMQICHKKADGTWETIFIEKFAWIEHQKHGDYQGECKQNDNNNQGGGQLNNGGLNNGGNNNGGGEIKNPGGTLNNGGGEIKNPGGGGQLNNGGLNNGGLNNGGNSEEIKKPDTQNGGEVIRPR